MQEGDVVHAGCEVREEIAHPFPALAILLEVPLGPHHTAFILLAAAAESFHLDSLAVQVVELWLVVERVNVAWPAVHEKENDALGLGRQVRLLRRQWIRRPIRRRGDAAEET